MKKKKGRILISAGLLLIAAAAVWSAFNLYDGFRAGNAVEESVRHLEMVIAPQAEHTAQEEFALPAGGEGLSSSVLFEYPDAADLPDTQNAPDEPEKEAPSMADVPGIVDAAETDIFPGAQVAPGEVEIPDYKLNPDMEMPVSRYNGQDYIGILEIPAIDLKLSVISKWSYPRLRIAPCRYSGSAYTNNLVISAHNYASHFGALNQLYEGAAVTFTDVDGNRFHYRVALKETLGPYDVDYMTNSGWDLTLFTCTPGGSYRVTVRCALIRSM